MSNYEKEIKILKVLGWREIPWAELTTPLAAREKKLYCLDTPQNLCRWTSEIFDDLEACRKAEMELIDDDMVPDWVARLCDIVIPVGWSSAGRIQACEAALRATAEQRAEALGLTLQLWKQGQTEYDA